MIPSPSTPNTPDSTPASGDQTALGPLDVLVLGASGYIGGRLIAELVDAGHRVRCLARTPSKLDDRPWRDQVDVVEGDLLEPDTLAPAFEGQAVVYYLVHSLGAGDDFEDIERRCAENASTAAADAGASQIVYLGGLGDEDDDLSPHLHSRHEVGRALAEGPTPVTELRAAIILGSGSASFEMLRGLTERLPVMTTPKWVQQTRCQPIAVRDVLRSLLAVLGRDDLCGVWQIGGPDVVTYEEMMRAYAKAAGLGPRVILGVPVLTPRLSAGWVGLVTDLPRGLATELVESLQNDVIITDRPLLDVIDNTPLDLADALRAALAEVGDLDVPTRWTGAAPQADAALPQPWDPDWAGGTVLEDVRSITIDAAPERVMTEVRALGGDDGWLGYDVLWDIRGVGDLLVGGEGRRRRRHPHELRVGDIVDMFRVIESTPTSLRLRAEMRMPGFGWLEWTAEPAPPHESTSRQPMTDGPAIPTSALLSEAAARAEAVVDQPTTLTQHVRFVPKGVLGRLYWYSLIPFHELIFRRLLAALRDRATATSGAAASAT